MDIIVKVDSWDNLGLDAAQVRQAVFCDEQGVPSEEEWDQWDGSSLHAVAYTVAGVPIATGRLLADGHIGRMAVLKLFRGQGIGGAILAKLIDCATETLHSDNPAEKLTCVQLHAQTQVMGFYSRYGFIPNGAIFLEVGIPHILMRRFLA